MNLNKCIRLASEAQCASILEIYEKFITDTVITFECKVPSVEEFSERMANIQKKYPWLVCEFQGNVVGYAYASQFNERSAYDWSVDFSVYIKPESQGKNLGKALYFALLELLKLQGYYNAYAGVTLPNIKSEGLHKSVGFKEAGVFHNAGFKFGDWYHVKWFELKIQEYSLKPAKPKTIGEINNTFEFNEVICKAEQMLNV